MNIYKNCELRKLPPRFRTKLGQLLDMNDDWKKLMICIPSEINPALNKYKTEHIHLVEKHGYTTRKSCGEILLDEWSTSGRIRPNVEILFDLLQRCQLYRVADYVAEEILHTPLPTRPLEGPAKRISTKDLENDQSLELGRDDVSQLRTGNDAPTATLVSDVTRSNVEKLLEQLNNYDYQKGNLITFSIDVILSATKNFAEAYCIGSGAFGTVYKLDLQRESSSSTSPPRRHFPLAIKLLHPTSTMIEDQFLTEIKVLSRYRHENLLSLVGFCTNGPQYCLVYEFMSNGTLMDAIACNDPEKILSWSRRLCVMNGVAKGLDYLHTALDKPLIHRDIKSANILLNEKLDAKIGDFGLAKSFSSTGAMSSALASTICGSSAYMAPEAFRGDISPKIDIFSFGVILLEILTGLSPYSESREGNDIVTYLEEIVEDDDISPFVDKQPGAIHSTCAQQIYDIARNCLSEKRRRPTSELLLQQLQTLITTFEVEHLSGKHF